MNLKKFALLIICLTAPVIVSAAETFDCTGQKFEYMYLLGGVAKKINTDLKGESPVFIKEFNKAANTKGAAGTKAMNKALDGITCTIFGIKQENFLSMTFKNKNDRFGDYQVEFTPVGGYQDWVFSANNNAPQCWTINVHKGGWYVKAPGSDDNYRIYARTEPKLGTEVVQSCR